MCVCIDRDSPKHNRNNKTRPKHIHSRLPVGETEFAPIAANVTRFCMFTEFTTEKNKTIGRMLFDNTRKVNTNCIDFYFLKKERVF